MNKSTRDNEQRPPAGGKVLELAAALPQPGEVVAELLRNGAQALLLQALEAEVAAHVASYESLKDRQGRQRIVRNGHLPQRELQTGIGALEVQVPRARDREPQGPGGPIQFRSTLLPPYLRRTAAMDELLPWLHLKGISTGDFGEALEALVGPQARGLSSSTISRLKQVWTQEYEEWSQRDLRGQRFVYLSIDGIYCQARLEEEKQCLLVAIGADAEGRKQLLALTDGYRQSEQSWQELLLDLQRRGLEAGPELAIGDGALGFWKALRKVYPQTRAQRCWVHKTRNVLDKLPKGGQRKAKAALQAIWMKETKQEAEAPFRHFQKARQAKYPRAAECMAKDREELLAFYDFPAEHWRHLRTTNPIESVFATVRLRTVKTRGCLSRKTAFAMVYRLVLSAQGKWRRLNGTESLPKVIDGVEFKDGIQVVKHAA